MEGDVVKALLPALARPLIEPKLPDGIEATWFMSPEDARAGIVDAEIAWVDMQHDEAGAAVARMGERLKWLFTIRAGVDAFDKPLLKQRGTILTNGVGVNSNAVAEFAMMGILAAAKRYDEIVRLADRHEWTVNAPGRLELNGSSALIIGYGTIGRMIGDRLAAFGTRVTGVTRSGRDGTLTPDAWRAKLGEFDWVILAAPSTDDTRAMFGAEEFAAMKTGAWLVNMARGTMVDQDALTDALRKHKLAGAFLDTVDPEPLPADHPLWDAPNVLHSMHLSGRAQNTMFMRGAELFLRNLDAFLAGRAMENVVDLDAGY